MGNSGSAESSSPSSPTSPSIEDAHEHDEHDCKGCEQEEECQPLPYNSNLAATVGYFERAVIVCTGTTDWPAKLEKTPGNFVYTLFKAIKSRDDITEIPKVTACAEASSGEGYDIYVYPEQVKYIGVKEEDIPVFIEDQIVKGEVSTRLKHESVSGKYHVLVCTHNSRDKRCGRSGTQALNALRAMIDARPEMNARMRVDGCSHVGGHKYAGVVVVYPPGDYYGYISAKNAEEVIKHYLDSKKARANQFWRGRMGIDEEQQAKEAGLTGPKKKKEKGERRDRGEGEKGGKGDKEKGSKGDKENGEKEETPTET